MGTDNGGKQIIEPDASLFAFLYGLHEADFPISPAQLVNAQKVLSALKGSADAERIKSHLAPLFSFSPDQQEAFKRNFDEWWKTRRAAAETGGGATADGRRSIDVDKKESGKIASPTAWWRTKVFKASAALGAVLLAGILWAVYFQPVTPPAGSRYRLVGAVRDADTTEPIPGVRLQLAGQTFQTQADGQYSFDYEMSAEMLSLSAVHPDYEPADIPVNPKDTASLDISLKRLPPVVIEQRQEAQRQLDETVRRTYEWLLIFAALLPFVIFGLWLLWRRVRRWQLEKWRRKHQPDLERLKVAHDERDLYNHSDFLRLTRELRRYRESAAVNLETARTVEATIRAGNFFTPVYEARRISPEYLILIDRTGYVDQNARLIDELVDRLKKQGVFVERYFFDSSPQICWREDSNERFYDLSVLAALYSEDRLLIFSDGAGLLEPFLNRPRHDIFKLLSSWKVRMLLITNAANPFHEWMFRQFGLPVLLAHESDLKNLPDLINPSEAPKKNVRDKNSRRRYSKYPEFLRSETSHWWLREDEPEEKIKQPEQDAETQARQSEKIEILRAQLENYLGLKGYELLCGCAVYPELLWDLSFYLSYHLLDAGEREETLENLVCLPWFRTGQMPGWLRRSLLDSLPAGREVFIRGLIEQLLVSYLQNPQRGFQLEIARETPSVSWTRRLIERFRAWQAKKRLYDLIKIEPPESPLRDYVFLNFLSQNRLAVVLPQKLRQALRFGSKNAAEWVRRLGVLIERTVSAILLGFYRQSTPLLGLSRLRTAIVPALVSVAGVLILLFSATTALITAGSVPQSIVRDLPETALDVIPPFPIPTVVPSITPIPETSPTPTVSPIANLPANSTPSTPITNSNTNTNANRQTPSPPPTISPTPVDAGYQVNVSLVNAVTKELIINGRLKVYPRDRSDEPPPPVFDQTANGSSQFSLRLAGYFVFIGSAPGFRGQSQAADISSSPTEITLQLEPEDNLSNTANTATLDCFNVSVIGPGTMPIIQEANFVARVETNENEVFYAWDVTGGYLLEGQGTSSIKVVQFPGPGTYTATVSVRSSNANCGIKTASTDVTVYDPNLPRQVDEFGRVPSGDLKARLDNFFTTLSNEPNARGYVVIYGTDREIASREKEIRDYIAWRKFDSSRITIVRGDSTFDRGAGGYTMLWIVPPGAAPPVFITPNAN